MTSGATLNRHKSETVVSTPSNFLSAVERRFGKIDVDLACTRANCKGTYGYVHGEQDSLACDWAALDGLCWLNPPYSNIAPWAHKSAVSGARILFLVPASIGANWFWDSVYPYAHVLSVGRMTFDGHADPYPKDLILACYGYGTTAKLERWDWRLARQRRL